MQKLYAENCKTPMQAIKEILNNGHTMFMDWKIQDSKDVLKLIFSSAAVPVKILAGYIYTYRQVDCKFYMEAKELDLLKTILRKKNEVGRVCLFDFLSGEEVEWCWDNWTSVSREKVLALTSHPVQKSTQNGIWI